MAASVRDIFDSRSRTVEKSGDHFWQRSQNRWNSRTYSLTLTYSFSSRNARKSDRKNSPDAGYDDGGFEDMGGDD